MSDPATPATPPSSAPSSSAPSTSTTGDVTFEAIMAQLQWMEADFGGRLNYLTNEICQLNTRVGCIAHKQACMAGFAPSPSLKHPAASSSIDDDDKDGAGSFSDDKTTTSQ